jgi:isocitrate/isopropylmalate dehydrogenase
MGADSTRSASPISCLLNQGPEVVNQATRVLQTLLAKTPELKLELAEHDFGGIAIDNHGEPLPKSTLDACLAADAILMGPPSPTPSSPLLSD